MATASDLKIIDAHLHLWQRSRFAYHWLEVGSAMDRDFRLEDIRREMNSLNVVGGLLMEATNTPQEIPWLLAICEADSRGLGVIGWIHLEDDDAVEQIKRWAKHKHFKGVRLNWLASRSETYPLEAAMDALQEHNLVVDILPHRDCLPEIAAFIAQHPHLTFVLDHLGGVPIYAKGLSHWFDVLRMLAHLPNTVIKFSGYTRPDEALSISVLRDYLAVAIKIVGIERMMFGSNWPLCLKAVSYTDVLQDVQAACIDLDTAAQTAFFYRTASATYKLQPEPEQTHL